MTALGRFVFGLLIVLILIAFWVAISAVGNLAGPPEWLVR